MHASVIFGERPDEVEVEAMAGGARSNVWVRRNIREEEVDGSKRFCSDEVHLVLDGTPSVEELDADELWERAEGENRTESERIGALEVSNADIMAALMELGDMIGGE